MPEAWYPGAIRDPGQHAGYTYGRTLMVSCVAHFTVGVHSDAIGEQGLFNWLVRRNGEVVQYAEADGLCWHAGQPYNSRGPGIEAEYYAPTDGDAIFTDAQRDACGALVRWLNAEWGIPLAYHDDPNNRLGDWHGFISHRSVTSDADWHSDYWPQEDWNRMVSPVQEDRMKPGLFLEKSTGRVYVYDPNNHTKTWLQTPDALAAWQTIASLNGVPTDIVDNDTSRKLLADAVDLRVSGGACHAPTQFAITGTAKA